LAVALHRNITESMQTFARQEILYRDQDVEFLHLAARQGHVPMVKLLLENRNVDVNGLSHNGQTPLMTAVRSNHFEVVRLLVECGKADLSILSSSGRTARQIASRENLQIKDYIFKQEIRSGALRGAEVKMVSQQLHREKLQDFWERCRCSTLPGLLSTLGWIGLTFEELKSTNHVGRSGLHEAAQSGNLEVLKYLTRIGLDISQKCEAGETPLMLACRTGHLKTVAEICKIGGVKVLLDKNDEGLSARSMAAGTGKSEIFKFLLNTEKRLKLIEEQVWQEEIQNVDRVRWEHRLREAASEGFEKEYLVELLEGKEPAGYDVTAAEQKYNNMPEVVSARIPRIDSKDLRGRTALHHAILASDLDTVVFLMSKRASVNIQDYYNDTPLHYAACLNNECIVAALLDAKADVGIVCLNGKRPRQRTRPGLARLFLWDADERRGELSAEMKETYRRELEDHVFRCVLENKPMELRTLLERLPETGTRPNINVTYDEGNTALHIASNSNCKCALVKLLLEFKADTELRNQAQKTPIMQAAASCNYTAVEHLFRHGADLTVRNENQESAIFLASLIGHRRMVKYLAHLIRVRKAGEILEKDAPVLHVHHKRMRELAGLQESEASYQKWLVQRKWRSGNYSDTSSADFSDEDETSDYHMRSSEDSDDDATYMTGPWGRFLQNIFG